jgi:hypothetical protein
MKTFVLLSFLFVAAHSYADEIRLLPNSSTAGNLPAYRIETRTAVYVLEKTGAGLASIIDPDGNGWLSFNPTPGSRAGGEYRGFPNAVHQQAGNYFHARNEATDASVTKVDHVEYPQTSAANRSP